MSDNLVKRYRMQGDYSDWWMAEVDGDGDGDGDGYDDASETEWVKANDHAAALVAKDAEIARLRGLLDSAASALYDADLSHTDHCGTMFNYKCTCGLDELRAALNTQHKGETP